MSDPAYICNSCGSSYHSPLPDDVRRCPYVKDHTVEGLLALRALGREFTAGTKPGARKKGSNP